MYPLPQENCGKKLKRPTLPDKKTDISLTRYGRMGYPFLVVKNMRASGKIDVLPLQVLRLLV